MTAIEWTDRTWNPVVGCTKVSAGCKNCYAKTEWDRRHKGHLAGKKVAPQYAQPFEVVQLKPARLSAPLGWRKSAMVFVNSVSDLFHPDVPFEYIDRVFAVMALTPQHTYQVLTKRPERMRAYASSSLVAKRVALAAFAAGDHAAHKRFDAWIDNTPSEPAGVLSVTDRRWPLPNVWLGTSVEDQAAADERICYLNETPAAVRFLSCEPLLGPLDLTTVPRGTPGTYWFPWALPEDKVGAFARWQEKPMRAKLADGIDWVIVGGESGPNARPMDLGWAQAIVKQCQAAGVAVFVKQLGAKPCVGEVETAAGSNVFVPDLVGLDHRKGADPSEWPSDLQFRQFPEVRRAS